LQPIWSPDGKYLVIEANRQEDGNTQTVLIDLEGKFAVPILENALPIGWLADGNN
jgi:Tol biopolymer transport system component